VLDQQDVHLQPEVESKGMTAVVTQTIMATSEAKQQLARTALQALASARAAVSE
jgi:hypothetical protein